MSAQGTTLGRGAVQVPVRPLIAVIIAALVGTIGLMVFDSMRGSQVVTSDDTSEIVATTEAHPTGLARGGVAPLISAAAIENSFAAVREQGAFAYHLPGRAHEVVVAEMPRMATGVSGVENPSVSPSVHQRSAAWQERLLWLKLRKR